MAAASVRSGKLPLPRGRTTSFAWLPEGTRLPRETRLVVSSAVTRATADYPRRRADAASYGPHVAVVMARVLSELIGSFSR